MDILYTFILHGITAETLGDLIIKWIFSPNAVSCFKFLNSGGSNIAKNKHSHNRPLTQWE